MTRWRARARGPRSDERGDHPPCVEVWRSGTVQTLSVEEARAFLEEITRAIEALDQGR